MHLLLIDRSRSQKISKEIFLKISMETFGHDKRSLRVGPVQNVSAYENVPGLKEPTTFIYTFYLQIKYIKNTIIFHWCNNHVMAI